MKFTLLNKSPILITLARGRDRRNFVCHLFWKTLMSISSNSQETSALLEQVISKLDRGSSPDNKWPDNRGEYWPLCPFHPDTHPGSFSVSLKGYHCFSCGEKGGLRQLAHKLNIEVSNPQSNHQTVGLTLAEYSQAKSLTIQFLQSPGIRDRKFKGVPGLIIPYYDIQNQEIATRYRFAMNGDFRFRWMKGSRL